MDQKLLTFAALDAPWALDDELPPSARPVFARVCGSRQSRGIPISAAITRREISATLARRMARLMAAAPQLYAALLDLCATCPPSVDLVAAHAAIKAATERAS